MLRPELENAPTIDHRRERVPIASAQWVAKGTDTIDWTNSTSQQIDGKTVYILDSADSITFSSDFGQYAYNLPQVGNSVLYFSTDTTDC